MIGTTLICTIAAALDADTLRCTTGQAVRIAGVSALERNGSCNSAPHCPTMRHAEAKPIADRLLRGRTIRFRVVGVSWRRLVVENREVRCDLQATGAVVEWPLYVKRYRLEACR